MKTRSIQSLVNFGMLWILSKFTCEAISITLEFMLIISLFYIVEMQFFLSKKKKEKMLGCNWDFCYYLIISKSISLKLLLHSIKNAEGMDEELHYYAQSYYNSWWFHRVRWSPFQHECCFWNGIHIDIVNRYWMKVIGIFVFLFSFSSQNSCIVATLPNWDRNFRIITELRKYLRYSFKNNSMQYLWTCKY